MGEAALKKFGLGQSEHDVLACARRQASPYVATPSLLLEEVRITSGALTTCVNRLISKGLVIRTRSLSDTRSKPVQLTEKGQVLIDQVTEFRFGLARTILQSFSAQDKVLLRELLLKVQGALPTDFSRPKNA